MANEINTSVEQHITSAGTAEQDLNHIAAFAGAEDKVPPATVGKAS